MPRRKKRITKSTNLKMTPEINKIIFGIIFLVLGTATAFVDPSSTFGKYLTIYSTKAFGEYFKFIVSPAFLLFAFLLFKNSLNFKFNLYRIFGFLFYFFSICSLIGYFKKDYQAFFNVYNYLKTYLGVETSVILALSIFVLSLIMLFRFSPKKFVQKAASLKPSFSKIKDSMVNEVKEVKGKKEEVKKEKRNKKEIELEKKKQELDEALALLKKEKEELNKKQKEIPFGKIIPRKIEIKKKEEKKEIEKSDIENVDFGEWKRPSIELLKDRITESPIDKNEIKRKQLEIEEKLLQFKIQVNMEGYNVGPTVIQYRLKPREGVKLQKIENLKKDLALALQAKSLRIQAPIPGLGVVGIEVPNSKREIVSIKEVISNPNFKNKKYEIPIAIGKDVNGEMVIGDLTKMPHLLVAGQTGSGKSVGMNGFLVSLLYKFSPSDLKMIMVDPKRVELSIYNGIPHLLTPVITNPEKALNALKWCVAEMLKRYDLATKIKARNLKEYNEKVDEKEKLPYIVMVVDELADLMMSGNKKEVEQAIARIAQMARAVGIHLIIATQRPSVDVITGLIKANIPSRIAFTVSSQIDSRTILDKSGAEDLLGKGDMLYYPTGSLEPERVQGVFVDTPEVEAVVNEIKLTVDPDMIKNLQIPEIANGKSKLEGSIMEKYEGDQDEDPEIVEKAILVVKEARKGSTSLIQRKLGLGYARAAKILDILEDLGVVGPSNGSKPREVYVD